jgi:adenylylsulfate kinase
MPSTYRRSFLKGAIWEVIAFIITTFIIYFIYGNFSDSLKFSLFLTAVKIPFFFIHERIWKKIKWGKIN